MKRRALLSSLAAPALAAPAIASAAPPVPVRIGGTGMGLAALRAIAASFARAGGGPAIILPSLGTSGGMRAVLAGAVDIAVSGRPPTASEAAAGLSGRLYARTPLGFHTRATEPERDLSTADVTAILRGRMATWPDGTPVRVVRRDPSEQDWVLIAETSPSVGEAVAALAARPGLLTATNDQDNADAMERLPGAFGAITLAQVAAEDRRLRPVRLDGSVPDVAGMERGTWPLVRSLHAVHGPSPRADILSFLDFLHAEEGRAVLGRLGHGVP